MMKNIIKNWLFRVLALLVVLAMVLANCGFQGPLYLPKKPVASSPTKKASSAAKIAASSTQNIK